MDALSWTEYERTCSLASGSIIDGILKFKTNSTVSHNYISMNLRGRYAWQEAFKL